MQLCPLVTVHSRIRTPLDIMKNPLLLAAVVLGFATTNQSIAEVLDGPNGPVEFIGLESWTPTELFEAIKEQDPDRPFHACAAVMKASLEFPDAAAFLYMVDDEDWSKGYYTVVIGVEDNATVSYRTPGSEELELPESWKKLQAVAEEDFVTVNTLLYVSLIYADEGEPEKLPERAVNFGANSENIEKVSKAFEGMREEMDHELALEVLARDKSWSSRLVATIVLGHYPEDDRSWHGIADSLIDSAQQVRDIAGKLIFSLTQSEIEVPVDWAGARETLLALFGGTYPFAFLSTLDALIATKIDPAFGLELAQERPSLLLAHVGAEHAKTREAALAFLTTVSEEDFGNDVDAWSTWIKQVDLDQ